MSAMPWTAAGEDTGEIIPVNHRPATTQHDNNRTDPASDRPFVRIATVSGAIAPCALVAYLWANTHQERTGGVRGLLFLALCVSLILCGIAVMHVLRCRVDDRRNEQLRLDLSADIVAAKTSIKRHLRQHADEASRHLDEACKEMASRLGDHAREMQSLVETRLAEFDQRLDVVAQRVDDTERAMVDMATAANIVAIANSGGADVHPLRPNGTSSRRPRGA